MHNKNITETWLSGKIHKRKCHGDRHTSIALAGQDDEQLK